MSNCLQGAICRVLFPGDAELPSTVGGGRALSAHYGLIEATDLRVSHDVHTGRVLPGGINGRRLETSAARHQRLTIRLQALRGELDPEHVLDRTSFVVTGPPLMTAGGQVIAGNHRSILIQEAARSARAGRPDTFLRYKAELETRCEYFGFAVADLEGFLYPVLVRVVGGDASLASAELEAINRLSDRALTKPKDRLSFADSIAVGICRSQEILSLLKRYFDSPQVSSGVVGRKAYTTGTVEFMLRTSAGGDLLQSLVAHGVLDSQDLVVYQDARTMMPNALGRHVLAQAIAAAAVGDALAFDDVDARITATLSPSLSVLLPAGSWEDPRWSELRHVFARALRLLRGVGGSRRSKSLRSEMLDPAGLIDLLTGPASGARESPQILRIAELLGTAKAMELRSAIGSWADRLEVEDRSSTFADAFQVSFGDFESEPVERSWDIRAAIAHLRNSADRSSLAPARAIRILVPDTVWVEAQRIVAGMPAPFAARPTRRVERVDRRAVLAVIVHLRSHSVSWRRFRTYWDLYPPTWRAGRYNTIRHLMRVWRSSAESWGKLCAVLEVEPRD